MDVSTAKTIVRVLADGIDPETGEAFDANSPYNQPRVVRALYALLGAQPGRRTRMTLDERRQLNLDNGRPRNSGLPWTDESRSEIATLFGDGRGIADIARHFERSANAIVAELVRQNLIDPVRPNT